MEIRHSTALDSDKFIEMQLRIDEETEFMMYEPGERKPDRERTKHFLETAVEGENLILVAEEEDKLWGFLFAERGVLNRIHHSAYIVIGICKEYRGKGIGTAFFKELETWAVTGGITRLELTVMCHNTAAIHLYEKNGFQIEGLKKNSMLVNSQFVDEYYMAKLF